MTKFIKKPLSIEVTLKRLIVCGKINKPSFQRAATRWNIKTKMKLIDTIMNSFPIPALVIWESEHKRNYKVIDGLQRLTTLMEFKNNEFPYHKLLNDNDAFLDNTFDNSFIETYYGFDDEEKEKAFIEEMQKTKSKFKVMTKDEKEEFNMYELDITWFLPHADEEYCRSAFIRINSEAKSLSRTELNLAIYDNAYSQTLREIYSGTSELVSEKEIIQFWHSCGYRLFLDKSISEQSNHVMKQIYNKIDTFVEQHIISKYLFDYTMSIDAIIKDVNINMRQIKNYAYKKTVQKTPDIAVDEFRKLNLINSKISEFKVPAQHNKDCSQISLFKLIDPETNVKKASTLYMYVLQCVFNNLIFDDTNKQKYFNNSFTKKYEKFYYDISTKHLSGVESNGKIVRLTSNASDSSQSISDAFALVKTIFNNSFAEVCMDGDVKKEKELDVQ